MSGGPVRHEVSADGAVHRVILDIPKGNVVDRSACEALTRVVESTARADSARLLVLTGAGSNFSFGASVEEHLPEPAPAMLRALGAAVEALAGHPYPTLAAVRGRCLGGGLELALACDLLLVEEGAVLAAPEIRLGVFAPAATALLQGRLPGALVAEMLLTGRELGAAEAVRLGLANRLAAQGELDAAIETWADESFRPLSAASLRVAREALRTGRSPAVERLRALERLYVEELLPLHDGTEGIRAFLEKRAPAWEYGS